MIPKTVHAKMPKVFITGCFGNVGSNAVRYFLTQNQTLQREDNTARVQVTCFDKQSPMTKASRNAIAKEFGENSFTTIWGDLLNSEQVQEAVKDQDAVIHLAAIIPPLAYKIPDVARKVNVDATKVLLDACAKLPQPPRFVFASSYSVMGPHNSSKPGALLTGDSPLNPQDSYGCHKAKCEKMVREYPGEWSILRIGSVSVSAEQVLSQGGGGGEEMNALLFSTPPIQRRHGVHSADAGRAFATCAVTKNPVAGKVLLIGGDSTWCVTSKVFTDVIFKGMGIGSLPIEAYRKNPPDADETYYYEEWMNTTETQQLLDFQKHTFQQWEAEVRDGFGSTRRAFLWPLAPFIRYWIGSGSIHYKYNKKGIPDPNAPKTMLDIMGAKPEPW